MESGWNPNTFSSSACWCMFVLSMSTHSSPAPLWMISRIREGEMSCSSVPSGRRYRLIGQFFDACGDCAGAVVTVTCSR